MAPRILKSFSKNFTYMRQQFYAAVRGTSFIVRVVCSAVLFCYLLSFHEHTLKLLSVTPGYLLPPNFWFWTAFTFCFLETEIWLVFADVITVGLCGKLLEPLWGGMEMFTFFALVNTSVAFLSVMIYILAYVTTSDPSYLFHVRIHGLAGYCAGVAVTVKQLMPEHVVLATPFGKLKNKDVPLCILILSLCFWPLGIVDGTYPIMFSSGMFSSWVYLRFFQYHSNGTQGDSSAGFSFASFFPRFLQKAVEFVTTSVFRMFLTFKLCKIRSRSFPFSSTTSVNLDLSEAEGFDTERRRKIALRALSERMNQAEQAESANAGNDDEIEENCSVKIAMPANVPQSGIGLSSTSVNPISKDLPHAKPSTSSSK